MLLSWYYNTFPHILLLEVYINDFPYTRIALKDSSYKLLLFQSYPPLSPPASNSFQKSRYLCYPTQYYIKLRQFNVCFTSHSTTYTTRLLLLTSLKVHQELAGSRVFTYHASFIWSCLSAVFSQANPTVFITKLQTYKLFFICSTIALNEFSE